MDQGFPGIYSREGEVTRNAMHDINESIQEESNVDDKKRDEEYDGKKQNINEGFTWLECPTLLHELCQLPMLFY